MILFLLDDTFSSNSLATLTDGSTGNIIPLFPIMSDTWLTVVPVDAPKYRTFDGLFYWIFFKTFYYRSCQFASKRIP